MRIQQIPPERLAEYAAVPIRFEVRSYFKVMPVDAGLGGIRLVEEACEPYIKDYDADGDDAGPLGWPRRFDVSNWAFFLVTEDEFTLGAATVAWNSDGVNMLEGLSDIACLWDIRVQPVQRGKGVGMLLFQHTVRWARERGCRRLKIETQNINVPACRFYVRMGAHLGQIHRYAYDHEPRVAHETMLMWYVEL
jgi:GNAT superfamily N-acetyltransferase